MNKMPFLINLVLGSLPLVAKISARRQIQKGMEWQPCPELNQNITTLNGLAGTIFDCGHLAVPLDYTDPNSELLQLDLFKANATREPVLGTVLINFGGPGQTAPDNLALYAAEMAANIGHQWNLVSWDPRGTGKTLPFDCGFNSSANPVQRHLKRDYPGIASPNLTQYFIVEGWDWAGYVADKCSMTMNKVGQYIGTSFTARDMMEIAVATNDDGLLRYYGWSYGTVLGSYAAAMFPERIDRMVLDANQDPLDYQAGHGGNSLQDADKAFSAFLEECLANKPNCALAGHTNATRVEQVLDPMNTFLQPLAKNATTYEGMEAYRAATQAIYLLLYSPASWPTLAEIIHQLLNQTDSAMTGDASTSFATPTPYNLGAEWAIYGIRGSDAFWRPDTAEKYLPRVIHQARTSSFSFQYSDFWPSARWKLNAKERYAGNFSTTTKRPILYVNGEYDPVTPISNAYAASKRFKGSVVLPHSGYGHGIIASPSSCVARHVQAYFQIGAIPAVGSRCQPNMGPWEMAAAIAQSTGL